MKNGFNQTGHVGDLAVFSMSNEIDAARIVKVTKNGYTVRSLTAPADQSLKTSECGRYRVEWFVRADKTFIVPHEMSHQIEGIE